MRFIGLRVFEYEHKYLHDLPKRSNTFSSHLGRVLCCAGMPGFLLGVSTNREAPTQPKKGAGRSGKKDSKLRLELFDDNWIGKRQLQYNELHRPSQR